MQEPCKGDRGLGSACSLSLVTVPGELFWQWALIAGRLRTLTRACVTANAAPSYVTCSPTLSLPGLGTREQSWEELARPLLSLACLLGWESLEIEGVSSSFELWVGAC